MAKIHCELRPAQLRVNTEITLTIPGSGKRAYPVVWLLHGGGGCCEDFASMFDLQYYSNRYEAAFVCGEAQNSSYCDMPFGPGWFTFHTAALPGFVQKNFPISSDSQDQYLCGISMGGHGAMKMLMTSPEKYRKAASLSGGVWLAQKYAQGKTEGMMDRLLEQGFGSDRASVCGGKNDCLSLATRAAGRIREDQVLLCCGKNDFSYEENLLFCDHLKEKGIPFRFWENAFGHDREAWNDFFPRVLEWMFPEA